MKHFLIVIMLILSNLVVAQDNDSFLLDIVPPSPMAYEMTRYDAQQPNLYTGTAQVSIPLYTIDFDGWQLPLSLSYHASGITTNQEATEVGLGWSLNSTAVISRRIQSGDDLMDTSSKKGYVYETVHDLSDLEDFESLSLSTQDQYEAALLGNHIDTEPDMFNYSFFGFSGAFSLKQKTAGIIGVQKHSSDGVELTFDESSQTFTIITPTGFKGYFTIKERTTNISGSQNGNINPMHEDLGLFSTYHVGTMIDHQDLEQRGNLRAITSWYLQRIVSPNGKEIFFKYNIDFEYGINENEPSEYLSVTSPSFGEINNGNNISKLSFSKVIQEHVYQEEILIPNELKITFDMENRFDIDRNHYRVEEFPPFIHDPDPSVVQTLVLKRYTGIEIDGLHPESSHTKTIEFNQSYFNYEYLHRTDVAMYLKYQMLRGKLNEVIINDKTYAFEYNEGLNGLPKKSTFAMDQQGFYNGFDSNTYLYRIEHGLDVGQLGGFSQNYYDSHPQERYYYYHQNRIPRIEYGISGSLAKVFYPTGGSSEFTYEPHDFYGAGSNGQKGYREFLPAINASGTAGNLSAGGLRIQKIETKDSEQATPITKTYKYTSSQTGNTSSGKLMDPLVYTGFVGTNPDPTVYTRYLMIQPSIGGLNTASGSSIGYSRVEEIIESSTEEIRTEYKFENQSSQLLEYNPVRTFNLAVDSNEPKNGGLLETKGYKDGTTAPVTESTNIYTTIINGEVKGLRFKTVPGFQANPLITFYNYARPIVGLHATTKSTQIQNFDSGSVLQTSDYAYDMFSQVYETITTNSSGQDVKVISKRLMDYTDTTCIVPSDGNGCMRDYFESESSVNPNGQNRVSDVMEQISYIDNEVIGARGFQYDVEHGNIVLRSIHTYDKANGAFVPSSTGFSFGGSYERRITFDDYDNEGNLLQQTLENGTPVAYIWGYDGNYPVVKADNVTYTDLITAYNATNQNSNFEDAIRSHPLMVDAMITTFKMDPLVGLLNGTDAAGRTSYYEYDNFGRLIRSRDLNQHIIQENEYHYKEPLKMGGLVVSPVGINFETVTSGQSKTEQVTITNNGNYDITVNSINYPNHFIGDPGFFTIPRGESYIINVSFNAPSSTGSYSGNLTINSTDINGSQNIILQATSGIPTAILIVADDCHIIENEFQTIPLTLTNSGNSTLYVHSVVSDDACISSSWSEPLKTNVYYQGQWVEQDVPYEIPPNASRTVSIQLVCPLNSNNNWDGNANLSVNLYNNNNPNSGTYVGASNILVTKYASNCSGPPNNPPAYTVSGDTTADCSSGMSGTITVNSGSIIVSNQWNQTTGPNFIGATITMSEVGTVGTGGVVVTPSSYPKTYSFSSGTCDCSNGYGTSQIQVSAN